MSTGTWEPGGATLPGAEDLVAAAELWRSGGTADGDGYADVDVDALDDRLDASLRERLRAAMQAPRGALDDAIGGLEDRDAVAVAKLLTVLELLPGFEAGPRSPVVPLVRHLRPRLDEDAFAELVRWIRAHSENRFLPHGSLQDRLRA